MTSIYEIFHRSMSDNLYSIKIAFLAQYRTGQPLANRREWGFEACCWQAYTPVGVVPTYFMGNIIDHILP